CVQDNDVSLSVVLAGTQTMLSELIIASTLFVNACAVLNFRLSKNTQDFNHFVVETEVKSVVLPCIHCPLERVHHFSYVCVLLSLTMTSVSDTTGLSSNGLDFLTSADAILKKTLTTIPAGRPRRGACNENKKQQQASSEGSTDDDLHISNLLHELRVELDVKRREEERLQKEIADILTECASGSAGDHQSRAFGMAVSRLNNAMLVVETDTKQLAASLRTISRLADNISGKVSALDVAKTRVVECLQLAGDMHDLGVCSEGVDECINNEDYEQAAQHIHRFLTLDRAVFQFSSSAVDKDAGINVSHSYEVLTSATTRLKEILQKKLEAAVEAEDIPSMQRFVKLFPLINEHNSGLTRFGKYLGKQIAKIGNDNLKIMDAGGTDDKRINVLYADTLFLFFEGIAALLETNQPLIESAYGPDKLLDFINMLQVDIDQVVGKVIDAFAKKRQLEKRLKTVQRILREDRHSDKGEVERLDALELDTLLSEICLMNTHTEMYWRFVRRRLKGASLEADQEEFVMVNGYDFGDDEEKKKRLEEEKVRRKNEREKKLDQLLNRSLVGSKMQEILGNYLLLEQYYMQESVRKAIDMDAKEEGLLSSVVDDVLFLVRKCVRRAMSSGSVDCVCAALNYGVALLETTFYQHLYNTIQAGYPSTNFAAEALQTAQNAYNVIQHGKSADADVQRDHFITAANNARGTGELLIDLRKGLENEWSKTQRSSVEVGKLEHAVSQLADVSRKMHHLATVGMESLCKTTFRPKLKTSCDAFLDLPHTLTDVQLAEFEAVDPFIEQFNANLDRQIASFEPVLHKENFQSLLLSVCSEVEGQFERVIMKCSFNRLGGLQLDREFRQLSAYLSGIAGWTARERCARLSQIVALLNVENVDEAIELREATRASPIARMLSANDSIRVLQLRTDLPAALIQKLEF
uniref:Conserved oligomeric Golgi complex subunit 4 n=1 Tax=Haemonchus contortus TaxID=6289 RepID=A0A7I4Y1Z1_HAECO